MWLVNIAETDVLEMWLVNIAETDVFEMRLVNIAETDVLEMWIVNIAKNNFWMCDCDCVETDVLDVWLVDITETDVFWDMISQIITIGMCRKWDWSILLKLYWKFDRSVR